MGPILSIWSLTCSTFALKSISAEKLGLKSSEFAIIWSISSSNSTFAGQQKDVSARLQDKGTPLRGIKYDIANFKTRFDRGHFI